MRKIKLAIADDESLILNLLQTFFKLTPDIDVQLMASSGEEMIRLVVEGVIVPEVFLLDLRMGDTDGVSTAQKLKTIIPGTKIIVYSSHYHKSLIGYMLKNNIDAFLPKGGSPEDLHRIIKIVHEKGHYFSNEQLNAMRSQISTKVPKPKFDADALTKREKEVLLAICNQKTTQGIADELFISKSTVEGHRNNLLQKTGARNSAGLVIYAVQYQLFNPNELLF